MSMTFNRFYSMFKPHKAASFNTIKRAKFTIVGIIIICILYNIPHVYITSFAGWVCLPYGEALDKSYGKVYYWLFSIMLYPLFYC